MRSQTARQSSVLNATIKEKIHLKNPSSSVSNIADGSRFLPCILLNKNSNFAGVNQNKKT